MQFDNKYQLGQVVSHADNTYIVFGVYAENGGYDHLKWCYHLALAANVTTGSVGDRCVFNIREHMITAQADALAKRLESIRKCKEDHFTRIEKLSGEEALIKVELKELQQPEHSSS